MDWYDIAYMDENDKIKGEADNSESASPLFLVIAKQQLQKVNALYVTLL